MSGALGTLLARAGSMRGLLRLCEVVGWCTAILLAVGNIYSAAIVAPNLAESLKDFSTHLPAGVIFIQEERWILVALACALAGALAVTIRRHRPALFVGVILLAIIAQIICTWAVIFKGISEIVK